MCLIFWFSSQVAEVSSEQSKSIVKVVAKIVNRITNDTKGFKIDVESIVRKIAHFILYFVLGILSADAFIAWGKKRRVFVWALVLCVLYAASDEIHQFFVPGRSMQLTDVLLDTLGSALGALLWIRVCTKESFKKLFVE